MRISGLFWLPKLPLDVAPPSLLPSLTVDSDPAPPPSDFSSLLPISRYSGGRVPPLHKISGLPVALASPPTEILGDYSAHSHPPATRLFSDLFLVA